MVDERDDIPQRLRVTKADLQNEWTTKESRWFWGGAAAAFGGIVVLVVAAVSVGHENAAEALKHPAPVTAFGVAMAGIAAVFKGGESHIKRVKSQKLGEDFARTIANPPKDVDFVFMAERFKAHRPDWAVEIVAHNPRSRHVEVDFSRALEPGISFEHAQAVLESYLELWDVELNGPGDAEIDNYNVRPSGFVSLNHLTDEERGDSLRLSYAGPIDERFTELVEKIYLSRFKTSAAPVEPQQLTARSRI